MLCRNGLHDTSQPGSRRKDGKCAECYRAKRRRAARTGRPNGRPRIASKTCEFGHPIGRSPSGIWRRACYTCGQIKVAAHNAQRAEEARAFWASPEGLAKTEARRLAEIARQRRRRATPKGRTYERERKSKWRATIPGQLIQARYQVSVRIADKEARIAELERELQYASS